MGPRGPMDEGVSRSDYGHMKSWLFANELKKQIIQFKLIDRCSLRSLDLIIDYGLAVFVERIE